MMIITGLLFAYEIFAQAPGDTLWTRTFEVGGYDVARCVQQTADNGFILAGTTSFAPFSSYYRFYVVRTDCDGDTLWTKTYGGSGNDEAYSVQQTFDGGFIIAGYTTSFGGGDKLYLVKINSTGDMLWERTYGQGRAYSVQQTTDGGLIIAGYSGSYGHDCYLVRTDSLGDTIWTSTYDQTRANHASSVQQTIDDGFIIAGMSRSFGQDDPDMYIMKTDSNGDTLWTRVYGGGSDDRAMSIKQTSDGGFIVAGYTTSFGAGAADFYLVRIDPTGNTLWTQTYGGYYYEWAHSVQQTNDGNFIIVGHMSPSCQRNSFDAYLVKTDSDGTTLWTRTYGKTDEDEYFYSVQQTDDGKFIIGGACGIFPVQAGEYPHYDFWLVKIENDLTAIENDLNSTSTFTLIGNYPNPFNPETTISFSITDNTKNTELTIYNLKGQKVKTLINEKLPAGNHQVVWDGKGENGKSVSSGIYFYKMNTNKYTSTKKMILMK